MHYDNARLQPGLVDEFGFEMYYVNKLRQHDAGGMTLGDPTLRMQVAKHTAITSQSHRNHTAITPQSYRNHTAITQ